MYIINKSDKDPNKTTIFSNPIVSNKNPEANNTIWNVTRSNIFLNEKIDRGIALEHLFEKWSQSLEKATDRYTEQSKRSERNPFDMSKM